jgi:alpha-methylacyl-CoA racemase
MAAHLVRRALTTTAHRLPLSGTRVLELEGLAAAPFAGMMLADFGAEVVRIDRPGAEPHFGTTTLGRGKKSVVLDLKTPDGCEAFRALARTADVLIEPFRPGTMERLGLGPDALLAESVNPRLVYARLTGWGQTGPLSHTAGHDINYIAATGALWMFQRPGERPLPPANLLGDFAGGGLGCVAGILLALIERQASGRGQVVDAAMGDGAAYLCSFLLKLQAAGLHDGERAGTSLLDGGAPFYDVYECREDGTFLAVGAIEPQFYALLLEGLGLGGGAPDDDGRNAAIRAEDQMDRALWPALRRQIAERVRTRTREEWADVFRADGPLRDACATPVLTPSEAAGHAHSAARGTFCGNGDVLAAPRLSRTPARRPEAPRPRHGEHTAEVLGSLGVEEGATRKCTRV